MISPAFRTAACAAAALLLSSVGGYAQYMPPDPPVPPAPQSPGQLFSSETQGSNRAGGSGYERRYNYGSPPPAVLRRFRR